MSGNGSGEHQGQEGGTDGGYRVFSESAFHQFCSRGDNTLLEPSIRVREPHEWTGVNFEFDTLFESVGDGLHADFKLRPEFFFSVQGRSHARDGGGEMVVEGVCV